MENTPSVPIYSIYCITNLVNQKKYVGFTSKWPAENRMYSHCKYKRNKLSVISNAIQKYGQENFKFEVILQGLDRNNVLSMETHFINEYNTLSPNGYNLTTGGENTNCSKISIKLKGHNRQTGSKNSQYGIKKTKELKERISNSLKIYNKKIGKLLLEERELIKLQKKEERQKIKIKDMQLYNDYYIIYKNLGWDKFKEITNYQYSQPNFVNRCSRLVSEFIPQNGKKR